MSPAAAPALKEVVVVGGSIAASTAVATLRADGFEGRVTVLSEEDLGPYTRVPLSKGVLVGRESVEEIVLAPLDDEVDLHLRTPATGLDLGRRLVQTPSGTVPYDRLVIASGARARRIGTPDQHERVLRTVHDALALRDDLIAASSVLVIGGGFLGMEIASTAIELGLQVSVVDLAPPLERLLGAVVAAQVRGVAERLGVRIVLAPGGVRLLGGGAAPLVVESADGARLTADVVVSAVGDVANVEWLVGSGVALRGGVVVDEHCRAAPGVVAAGDVALTPDGAGGARRNPSWTNAVEQARAAARTLLLGADAPPHRPSGYVWTEQFGQDVKMVGELGPTGAPAVLDGDDGLTSALLAWPDASAPSHVLALNHRTPPARLKRMLAPRPGVRA